MQQSLSISYLNADPTANFSPALRYAVQNRHLDTVQLLLPVNAPKAYFSALGLAIEHGHLDVLECLLSLCRQNKNTPVVEDSRVLSWAAYYGHKDILEKFLSLDTPPEFKNEAIGWAADAGRLDIVRLLIPYANPKANNSNALMVAADHNNQDMMELLWDVSDPEAALHKMKENGVDETVCRRIENRLEIKKNQKELFSSAESFRHSKAPAKKSKI